MTKSKKREAAIAGTTATSNEAPRTSLQVTPQSEVGLLPGLRKLAAGFMKGTTPETWHCIDCGVDTAPGCLGRVDLERAYMVAHAVSGESASVKQTVDDRSEIYTVREAVWRRAKMEPWGGCLCISCIEKRLGRRLRPRDFLQDHPLNGPSWHCAADEATRQRVKKDREFLTDGDSLLRRVVHRFTYR